MGGNEVERFAEEHEFNDRDENHPPEPPSATLEPATSLSKIDNDEVFDINLSNIEDSQLPCSVKLHKGTSMIFSHLHFFNHVTIV